MARKTRLTFTISRALLATGVVAATALAGACDDDGSTGDPNAADTRNDQSMDVPDETQVSVNPFPDTDAADDFDEAEVSVNPDGWFDTDADDTADVPPDDFDEAEVSVNPCFDDDDDGYWGGGFCAEDCDDFDPAVNPGAAEVCDGKDNNCDGQIDEGFDGTCEPMCVAPGGGCSLVSGLEACCTDSFCQDVGAAAPQGEGVCCLPDGAAWAEATGGGDACCNKDLDGDGLCGPI